MSAGRSVCLSEQPKENHRLEAHAFGPKESTVFSFGGRGGTRSDFATQGISRCVPCFSATA